jgi:hypothetical protein
MENEKKYENFKRLIKTDEWKLFVEHIEELVKGHAEASVNYSSKGHAIDSQRQAWICEGLREAIDEPESVIAYEESLVKKTVSNICRFCGNLIKKDK